MHSAHTRSRIHIVFFLLFLFLFSSCKDKWLRVFFDGVPEPESREDQLTVPVTQPKVAQPAGAVQALDVVVTSRHPDYAEKKCDRCHDKTSSNYLTAENKEICFTCHNRGNYTGKFVHGPVAVKDCLVCHLPHKSKNRKLLVSAENNLCFKCHRPETVKLIKDHDRKFRENCLSCHLPHVSDNRNFVKDSSL